MALKLTFSACLKENCSKLLITDTTDVYHAVNNPTGWGAPNLVSADIATAEILIEYIDDENVTSEIVTVDVLSQIPDPVTDTFEFDLIDETFSDGYYKITYTIVANNGTIYRKVLRTFFYCNVQCCIDKLIAAIPDQACECDIKKLTEELFFPEVLMEGLKAAAGCGNTTTAYKILERLEKICANSDCDCA